MSLKVYKMSSVDETKFSPDKVYKKGEGCVYLGKTYVCITETSVSEIPSISSSWDNERSGSIRRFITLSTTSNSSTWTPSITHNGSELEWEFSGDMTSSVIKTSNGSQSFDLSSNTGNAEIILKNVESVTGLEFNNLGLTSINVSQCKDLQNLALWSNSLTTLDITNNSKLLTVFVDDSSLTTLDISKNPVLERITADNNNLTALDFSNNPEIEYLYLSNNSITTLDISYISKLESMYCSDNGLTSLTLGNTYSAFTFLHISNNSLPSVDISLIGTMEDLRCENNQLTELSVANANNSNLSLRCAGNTNLTCIQVDNPASIPGGWTKDATATYSVSCPL